MISLGAAGFDRDTAMSFLVAGLATRLAAPLPSVMGAGVALAEVEVLGLVCTFWVVCVLGGTAGGQGKGGHGAECAGSRDEILTGMCMTEYQHENNYLYRFFSDVCHVFGRPRLGFLRVLNLDPGAHQMKYSEFCLRRRTWR